MRRKQGGTDASSMQIGYVLNTGIMTAFIAVLLVILSGGFTDDVTATEELELVSDEIQANIIEADMLALTEDEVNAFFEPPESGVDYQARINTSGYLIVVDDSGNKVVEDLDGITETSLGGLPISFTERSQNVIVEYSGGNLQLDVQSGVTR